MTQDDILTVIDTALSTLGLKVERTYEWSAEHPEDGPERVIFRLAIVPITEADRFRDLPGPRVAADRAEVSDGFGVVSVPVGGQEFRVIVDDSGRPADPDQMALDDCPDRFPEEGERLQALAESHTIVDPGPPSAEDVYHSRDRRGCDIEGMPVRRGRLRVVDGGSRA